MSQPPWGPQQGYPPHPQQRWVPPPPPKPKWHHGASVVVPSLLCCFPAGLAMLWTSPAFTRNAKVGWTVGVVALLFVGAIGGATAPTQQAQTNATPVAAPEQAPRPASVQPAPEPEPEVPATPVDAAALIGAYEANEVRADGQFKGQIVETAAVVHDISKDILGGMYLIVGPGERRTVPGIQASFSRAHQDAISDLSKGDRVRIRCRVKGLVMHVQLGDCAFVR